MTKSLTQKALYSLSILALIILILDIHNLSKASLFFMAPPDGSRALAFKELWLPELPFLLFLVAFTISTYLKWFYILWVFPLISLHTLHNQLTYILKNHSYIGQFYLTAQLFSLLTSLLLIFGMLIGLMYLYKIYKDHNLNNK